MRLRPYNARSYPMPRATMPDKDLYPCPLRSAAAQTNQVVEVLQPAVGLPGTGSIEDFIGLLAGQADRVATIDEINEAVSDGWAGMQ